MEEKKEKQEEYDMVTKEVEKVQYEEQAFMAGYLYAIQVLKDGISSTMKTPD